VALAALKENRPRAHEDFIAVAEDDQAEGHPSKHLGNQGATGLLMGNMLTMRFDLSGCDRSPGPALDMKKRITRCRRPRDGAWQPDLPEEGVPSSSRRTRI
jgi:prolyl oligopeptidase PreP (S9A serine peptidase family)